MKPTIPEGAKVFITHHRYNSGGILYPSREIRAIKDGFLPQGGKTDVRLLLPDGREATGEAVCSKRDNFSKVIGRNIAIGRALKSLQ